MNSYSMVISLYCISPEDLDAGFRECTWEIENLYLSGPKHREEVREAFDEAFETLTGGGHKIVFSDEMEKQEQEIDEEILRESINTFPLD